MTARHHIRRPSSPFALSATRRDTRCRSNDTADTGLSINVVVPNNLNDNDSTLSRLTV